MKNLIKRVLLYEVKTCKNTKWGVEMTNINKDDFIDVYVYKTLNEIKKKVTDNIVLVNKEREEEADKKMSLVLKDIINSNFKNLQRDPNGNLIYTLLPIVDEKENYKVRLSLVLYYAALYFDSVDLLHELLKAVVEFDGGFYINLHYLNKVVSKQFQLEEYIEYLNTCGYIFRFGVGSVKTLSEEEQTPYIERIAKLFKEKYSLIQERIDERDMFSLDRTYENIFVKENLDTFTDETYRCATEEQLEMINSCAGKKYSKETCDRLNYLMQNKGYSNFLCNFDLMMKLFTDEELEKLTYDQSYAIASFAENEEMLNKIIKFVTLRPDLSKIIITVSKRRFMKTNIYTLIEACNYAKNNYCSISGDIEFELVSRGVVPKALVKRIFGAYNKRDS